MCLDFNRSLTSAHALTRNTPTPLPQGIAGYYLEQLQIVWATPVKSTENQQLPAASAARGSGGDGGLSKGTAVGIAVGVTGGVLLIALAVIGFLVVRYRRWYQYYKREQGSGQRGSPGSPRGVGGVGPEYGTASAVAAANTGVLYGTEDPSRCGGDLCGCWCNCRMLGLPAAGGGRWDKCSRSPTLPSVAVVSREASMPYSNQAGAERFMGTPVYGAPRQTEPQSLQQGEAAPAAAAAAAAMLAVQEGQGPNAGHHLCSQHGATVSLALSGSGPSGRNLARQLLLLQQHEQARVACGGVVSVRPSTPQAGFVHHAGRTYASVGAHTEELSPVPAAAAASTHGATAEAAVDAVQGLPRFPSAPSAPLTPLTLPQQPQQQQQSCRQAVYGATAATAAGSSSLPQQWQATALRQPNRPSAPGSGACGVPSVDIKAEACGAGGLAAPAAAGGDVVMRGTAVASCRRLLGLSPVAAEPQGGSAVGVMGRATAGQDGSSCLLAILQVACATSRA